MGINFILPCVAGYSHASIHESIFQSIYIVKANVSGVGAMPKCIYECLMA
jgi:hypothetical protein